MRIKQNNFVLTCLKIYLSAGLLVQLVGVSSWTPKVVSSVSQGTYLGCVFDPQLGRI